MSNDQQIINQCQQWLESIIIGLNFCPFAKKEFVHNTIAYPILKNVGVEEALHGVIEQCVYLDNHKSVETTLIIFSENFQFFDDYLELVDLAGSLLIEQGYEGIYQIASFHPDYYFDGVDESDASNFTNRSPYPIIHLIREESLAKAVRSHPDPEGIPDKNIAMAKQKGRQYFIDFLQSIKPSQGRS